MIRIGVVGFGNLGKNIIEVILDTPSLELGGVIGREGNSLIGKDVSCLIGRKDTGVVIESDILATLDTCDLYIDCTNDVAFRKNYNKYNEAKKPLIIGTTGFNEEDLAKIKELSNVLPVILCSNFNIGVYKFIKIIQYASQQLGFSMDIDLIETHRKTKKDNPSGTSKSIENAIYDVADANNINKEEINLNHHSLRAGDIAGEHTVLFTNMMNEQFSFTHKVSTRKSFAQGIVPISEWIVDKAPGYYTLDDVFSNM